MLRVYSSPLGFETSQTNNMTDTPPGGGPPLPQRWGAALGNIADAAVRAETLGDAIDKALWLDEGALEAAAPAAQATERFNVSEW